MTTDIAIVLGILVISLILFISEAIRMDLVALLVLGALAVTQLVEPEEALAGFSNGAVVTVWAMFILSEGLTRTGIADVIGRQVMRVGGTREVPLIVVIMITGAVLSAFMNNIGVAALMLPVVVDIARRTNIPPSRLLMPLAYSTLLGGLMTLIGTAAEPANQRIPCAKRVGAIRTVRVHADRRRRHVRRRAVYRFVRTLAVAKDAVKERQACQSAQPAQSLQAA